MYYCSFVFLPDSVFNLQLDVPGAFGVDEGAYYPAVFALLSWTGLKSPDHVAVFVVRSHILPLKRTRVNSAPTVTR